MYFIPLGGFMSIDIKQGDSSPINEEQKFGKGYEIATISLAFDHSEFFSIMMPYLKVDFFEYSPAAKYVFALLKFFCKRILMSFVFE